MLLAILLAADACALLKPGEIARVQGSAVVRATPSASAGAEQCYFLLGDPVRSVSLEVRRSPSASAVREKWAEMLHADPDESIPGPRKVAGVGKAALWSGSQKAGALYVLARRAIVRVSVGGPGDEDAKVKACSQLAQRVLRRLGTP